MPLHVASLVDMLALLPASENLLVVPAAIVLPFDVVDYLLTTGLVTRDDALGGTIDVRVLHHKNLCFHVSTPSIAYLIKTSRLHGDISGLAEAHAYERLRRLDESFVARYLPAFVGYDTDASVLTLTYLSQSTNLRSYHDEAKPAHAAIGAEIGSALAYLHGLDASTEAEPDALASCPWVLQVLRPPVELLLTESGGTIELVRIVQQSDDLAALVSDMRHAWTCNALIHHDMRLENILTNRSGGDSTEVDVTMIDWELCAPGWACWDVACLLSSYVSYWALGALAIAPPPRPGEVEPEPPRQVDLMAKYHPLIRALWESYTGHSSFGGSVADCITVARLVSARLIQTAMEYCQGSPQPTREAIQLLEIAKVFARRPAEGWVHVLGLSLGTTPGTILTVKP